VRPRFTVDDLARPLALGGQAHRIVSLAPSCTESLLALGALDRLVGIEEHTQAPEVAGLARVGGFKHVDVDAILALAPDLVVAAAMHAVAIVPRLVARGVPVFVTQPRTLDGLVDGMARVAAVAGIAASAAGHLTACRARIAAVVERTLTARRRPLVYVELSPQGHTGGPASVLDDLITRAGGVNLGGLARVEWPVLSARSVRRFDPDVIVIARYPGSASPASLRARAGWPAITALMTGRVWELAAAEIKQPGPGLIDGLEHLAALLATVASDQAPQAAGASGRAAPSAASSRVTRSRSASKV
jgi:ABC-type Fe3+-hydroxamate transport system substrate-binding protein